MISTLSILVHDAVTIQIPPLYRVLHDVEMGLVPRDNPEVWPLNGLHTTFDADYQLLSYALNTGMNSLKWRATYGNSKAFNNGSGYGGGVPYADYVNQMDLSSPNPMFDKTRICGGATITGAESEGNLIVDILDGTQPAPELDWLLDRPWLYFHAVISTDNGIVRFPENNGNPVLVPLIGHGVAVISLNKLQRVNFICDPYFIGSIQSPYV